MSAQQGPAVPVNVAVAAPRRVYVIVVLWMVFLLTAFLLYTQTNGFRGLFPARLGPLPFAVAWFGAIGGSLISLTGIYTYNQQWQRSYNFWYYTRPLLGALIGTTGSLMFLVLSEAAQKQTPHPNAVFYDVVALAIGYREASFRALLARLIDTIILPAQGNPPT